MLYKQCYEYLKSLGIRDEVCKNAFSRALQEQYAFEEKIAAYNQEVLNEGREKHKLIILLAGRPYHSDPLIQHKVCLLYTSFDVKNTTNQFHYIYNFNNLIV